MSAAHTPLLVVMDVDSTLSNEEGIDELARAAGPDVAEEVAAITRRAMAGEIDFSTSLDLRIAALKGLPATVIEQAQSRVTATPGARELVDAVHRAGGIVCAVSGGFHELVDSLLGSLGVDQWAANRLEVSAGVLTGARGGELIDGPAKARWLSHWADQWGALRTVAIGDGANDLDMMAAADVSIGFVPKALVRQQASHCIEVRDVSRAIEILGLQRQSHKPSV
ncbi:MAG: phosphoserine phosphatase SerB [Pontimonas sp.]